MSNLSLVARFVPESETWPQNVHRAVRDGGYGGIVTFDDSFRVSILTRRNIEKLPRAVTSNRGAIRAVLARLLGERPAELQLQTGRLTFQAPDMLMLKLRDDKAALRQDAGAVYGAFSDELGRPIPNRQARSADPLLYLGRISHEHLDLLDDIEAVVMPAIPRAITVGEVAMKASSGGAWVDI